MCVGTLRFLWAPVQRGPALSPLLGISDGGAYRRASDLISVPLTELWAQCQTPASALPRTIKTVAQAAAFISAAQAVLYASC